MPGGSLATKLQGLDFSNDTIHQQLDEILKDTPRPSPEFNLLDAIARSDTPKLRDQIIDSDVPVLLLPAIITYLRTQPRTPEVIESLAYLKFHDEADEEISLDDLEFPLDFDFVPWRALKESNIDTTPAGYATMRKSTNKDTDRSSGGYFTASPWIIELMITNPNKAKTVVDQWWPLAVPALLNLLDTSDLATKAHAVRLTDLLASHHLDKLKASGLIPVVEASIEPCLNFLPPLVEPARTKQIHRPAVNCLAKLAAASSSATSRLHFVAREGCLKPFLHTQENVDLTIYFLNTLQEFVHHYLKSLTVAHLKGLVDISNRILCDPFIDYSPQLINTTCETMETVVRWTWPRIDQYKYSLLLGITKAGALDSQYCQLLQPSKDEIDQLQQVQKTMALSN